MTQTNSIEHARKLHRAGDLQQGKAILSERANQGDIDAMVELAFWELDAGNRDASNTWIAVAERVLHPKDWDGHVSLYSAYDMALGEGTRIDQQRRAVHHLTIVAEAGNVVAQLALARRFLYGLNGCEKSESEFERWVSRAAAAGSPAGTCLYAEFLLDKKLEVPLELLSQLRRHRDGNERVQKLLQALEPRSGPTRKP